MSRLAWLEGMAFVVFLFSLHTLSANAQVRIPKQVLLLEDQTSAPAIDAIEREFLPTLDAKSTEPIDYFRESLDTILITDKRYKADVRDWYQRKYGERHLDLIVSIGPESHDFLLASHEQFFPNVPVVFGLDGERTDPGNDAVNPSFAGVWTDVDPVSTVDAARLLMPTTKSVMVVAGTGYFDQMMFTAVKKKLQDYKGIEVNYLPNVDLSSMLQKVAVLPKDTVILYLAITRDQSLHHFFARNTLTLISHTASVPVFCLGDTMVGRGCVGGRVTAFIGQGTAMAGMAARLLAGQKPADVPSVVAPTQYMYDWKELQRWKMDESRLPVESVVVNRELSAWEKFYKIIVAILVVLLLQSGLVVYLFIERAKRRRTQIALEHDIAQRQIVEAALRDLSIRLISAQEEERSRIARELHDDFNQRLAVLAMDLERVAQIIPDDPDLAVQKMHDLWDQASCLGSDLHTLSHKLHSSVLEHLGLVEGVRSLCSEFREQQGIHVEFTSQGVPRSITPGISLCFFRIVQEGLRNVKKHSGGTKATVQLKRDGSEITLTIFDDGVGFNPVDSSIKMGLGLRSMQERLRSVGGTIEIRSQEGRGTQLSARAPISTPVNVKTAVAQ